MTDTTIDPNVAQRGVQTAAMDFAWRMDADDPRNQAALGWTCDICQARINDPCTNTIEPGRPLPGRIVHMGRLIDRRREK